MRRGRNYEINLFLSIVVGMIIQPSFKRSWVQNHLQTCHRKYEEGLCQLSVTQGKMAEMVTMYGHIERKNQGGTA